MSGETDYGDIAERAWDELPEPKIVPTGSWRLKTRNASFVKGNAEQPPKVLFFYTPKEPMDDVSADELAELGDDYDFNLNNIVATFYVDRGWDQVKKHLAKHEGFKPDGKKSAIENLKNARGTEVIANVGVRTYENNQKELVVENTANAFAKPED